MTLHSRLTFRRFAVIAVLCTGGALPAADIRWTNPIGGNWSVPGNWSAGAVPGASDGVLITNIGTFTVTLDVDATVASLTLGGVSGTQTFSASFRTLAFSGASVINGNGVMTLASATVSGAGVLTNLGTLNADNGTINAALVNQGLLVFLASNSHLDGSFENQAGATMRLLGDPFRGSSILNVASGFTNRGTLELTSLDNARQAVLNVSSGSLVNAAGGQLNVLAGMGGGRTLGAQLDNRGTVTINQALLLSQDSADHLNSGTINLGGGDITVNQSGSTPSFTTTGGIDIASGRTFTISRGIFNFDAGTVSGDGTINLNSTTANFTPNFSNLMTALQLASATLNGPGVLTNVAGKTLNIDNSTINAALVNQGLLVFRASNNHLDGSFENQAAATVRLLGDPFRGQAILNVASGFTNNGIIELTSLDSAQAVLDVSSGSLVNAASGQINVLAGMGGGRTLGAQLDNRGTVTINQALLLSQDSADHLNSGTINLGGGDFTVNQSGSTPSFTTTGVMDIGSGRTFTVSGGTFNYAAGTVGGAGTMKLNFTTANFTPNFSNLMAALQLASATLNGPGVLTNVAGKTLNIDNSTINAALVNQGLLVFQATFNHLDGSFENQAGATVRLLGDPFRGQAILNVASGFTNHGIIELTSLDSAQAVLNVSSGSLFNAAGGQLNVLAGMGGGRTLGAQLDNRGTVMIEQSLLLSQDSANHLNSGTINLSSGDFTVSQSGSAPSFTNAGVISISSNRTITISGGTFVNVMPGIIQGFGALDVRFASFANAGNVNPGVSPGVLKVVGDFPQTATGKLNIEIGGRVEGVDYDQLIITGHATLNGTLKVQLQNGFRPSGTDVFEIIRYNSHAGSFDHIDGLNIGGGLFLQPLFSATNVILTTIDTRPRIVFQSAKLLSNRQIELNLTGTAGQDFVIESTTNLSSAVWAPVLTNANAGAVFHFVLTDVTNFAQRFFRTSQ